MIPKFFKSPIELRKWFIRNYNSADELWVGYYKKDSGKPSITWPESVDAALCFGWIDGIRKSIDDVSYKIRFTPRRKGSIWSAVNINRAKELIKKGLMQSAGLTAFDARNEKKSEIYSYEQRKAELDKSYLDKFRKNRIAGKFYQSMPTYYRKTTGWWILSAKKEETRFKRLQKLIDYSSEGKKIPEMEVGKQVKAKK
ncbi:MAG: YdeI/OmpD-associated family protein [Melioribacter sp.]|nr:YdeI/OmpD-associated family protein [Melioribacter sp.]